MSKQKKRHRSDPGDRWAKPESTGQRPLRMGELVRHALSDIFLRESIRDPALHDTAVTFSEVRMSPDLRHARVYVMPLGGQNSDAVLAALGRIGPWLSHQVGKRVRMKYAVRLSFELDTSFDNATHIDTLLKAHPTPAEAVPGEEDLNPGDRAPGDGELKDGA